MIDVKRMKGIELEKEDIEYLNS